MRNPVNTVRLMIEIIIATVVAEFAVMFLMPRIAPNAQGMTEALLVAAMLSILAGPVILWRMSVAAKAAPSKLEIAKVAKVAKNWPLILGVSVAVAAGIGSSGLVARQIYNSIRDEARSRFELLVSDATREVHDRNSKFSYGLRGVRGVYAASKSVQRGAFRAYVESRDLLKEFPGSLGIGFIQRVNRSDLDTFLTAEWADEGAGFAVNAAPQIDLEQEHANDLYIIKHIFPLEPNRPAWGLDLGSESVRREAIERCIATGLPSITGKITLVQDQTQHTGFHYLLPVYRNGAAPKTEQDRLADLVGLVVMPIVFEVALADLSDKLNGMIDVEIFDGKDTEKSAQIFDLDNHLENAVGLITEQNFAGRMFNTRTSIDIGGRTWSVTLSTRPKFEATVDCVTPVLAALGGTIMSMLVGLVLWTNGTSLARSIILASSMTHELRITSASLEEAQLVARMGNWSFDPTSGELIWSKQVYALFARDQADGPPDYASMLEVLQPEDAPILDAAILACFADGMPFSLVIRTRETPGAKIRYLRVEGRKRTDDNDTIVGLFGTATDVTAEISGQNALQQARIQAEAASHSKSEFLANMSHEIRTPLTAILGYADLLRDEGNMSPTQRIETIDTIRNAGAHLLIVINDILDLSKIEADKMTIERVATPLTTILQEVTSLIRPRAIGKGVKLTTALATSVPDSIISDPTRLWQILMNLAGNAIKFTEEGTVTITAHVMQHLDGARLVIDVDDTGPGMSPEQAGRLFQAFSQVDNSITRKFGGTGLGLTISRRLATLMGGEVTLARTEPGKGSCFRIELPLEVALGAAMVDEFVAVASRPAEVAGGKVGMLAGRILLAEDGLDNQRLIAFHLRKSGATVDIADNGRIALEMIDKNEANGTPYDLLLTDMQMPEMDGYTLARTLRARGSRLPIVALTAHAMAEDRHKCLDSGCDDYATKPIEKKKLLATCSAWIGKAYRAQIDVTDPIDTFGLSYQTFSP